MARGSVSDSFGHYPRDCKGCGGRLKITGDEPIVFLSEAPRFEPTSWHAGCWLKMSQRRRAAA